MDERKLTRRQIVERLLAGIAAGAAWPLIASAHPIHEHLRNAALLDRADTAHTATAWKPLFLNAKQDRTLVPLAEAIVPGSTQAHVSRFIDLLLSADTREHQRDFAAALCAVEEEAEKRWQRDFQALTASERESLLTNFLSDESKRSHFENLKGWIVGAYYSSEDGMRELGWDGNHAFAKFPGCEHAGAGHANLP